MSLVTILLTIALIIVLGAAIYLWIDRKDWQKQAEKHLYSAGAVISKNLELQEVIRSKEDFANLLDEENQQLTLKCNQYEALLKTRLDEIPVADDPFADMNNCNQEKCDSGECCKKCASDECPDRKHEDSVKKPCCSCWNGVYNIPACEDCNSQNGFENYVAMN